MAAESRMLITKPAPANPPVYCGLLMFSFHHGEIHQMRMATSHMDIPLGYLALLKQISLAQLAKLPRAVWFKKTDYGSHSGLVL